jgi:hypothetical protein
MTTERIHAVKRTASIALLAALALAACGDGDDNNLAATQVCVDHNGNRVEDWQCPHDNGGMSAFEWYYIMSTLNQPRVGMQVVHNTYYSSTTTNKFAGFKAPASVPVERGVPKTGWTPTSGSKSFVPKDKSNITAPKVIQQAPAPMYQQKPKVNKPPANKPVSVKRR